MLHLDPTLQPTLLQLATAYRTAKTKAASTQPSPKQRAFDQATAKLERTQRAAASAQLAVSEMEREILRIQQDETKLRRRVADDRAQLGAATDPEHRKDLQHDMYAAKSRIADLMSELQEAHNEIHALRTNAELYQQEVEDRKVDLERARIDLEEAAEESAQETSPQDLAAALPKEIVLAFEEQREVDGVGAAPLTGRACGGCFIVLPVAERSAIVKAPSDALPQCPECGTYLVRGAV